MKEVTLNYVIENIKQMVTDPLCVIFFCTWKVKGGEIRLNGEYVQVKRDSDKYFSFGEHWQSFISRVGE